MLAASRTLAGEYAEGTDGQIDGRQTVTLRFQLDAPSVNNKM